MPVALAEADLLDTLVTDVGSEFRGYLARRVGRKIHGFRATSTPSAIVRQQIPRLLRRPTNFDSVDLALSRKASRLAHRRNADVWAYSGYGQALRSTNADGARVLFVFHPRPQANLDLLSLDAVRHPEAAPMVDQDRSPDYVGRRDLLLQRELGWSNYVVVASDFTKRSLPAPWREEAVVVPYGCPAPLGPPQVAESGRPQLLFVGQAIQRKGLHHLAAVWPRFEGRADLTVVASHLDPAVALLLPPSIRVLPRQESTELTRLYLESDALLLPSLVEGFGLVLGEALAGGCALIGSRNTGLVDLCLPESVGYVHDPGDLDGLANAIEAFLAGFDRDKRVERKRQAQELAEQRPWSGFRSGIVDAALAARQR